MTHIDTKTCHDEIDTKLSQLEFVRLKIPRLIPIELIDAVKGRTFTPEQFYENQEQHIDNPYNLLYALVDEKKKIHGYLWAVIEWDGSLFVNTFSITKEYWGKGKAIPLVCEFLKEIVDKVKVKKVFWATTNEKFFMKHGFRKSKIHLMEYNSN